MNGDYLVFVTDFQISYTIKGLENLLRETTREIKFDKVTFRTRETQKVGSIILQSSDADTRSIEIDALGLVDKALGALCFAFHVEAFVVPDSYYVKDLTNTPDLERVHGSLTIRTGSVKYSPDIALDKIKSLPKERHDVLDLALRYYKVSDITNPYRIESYFSCMSVIIRGIMGISVNDWLRTEDLKNNIKRILAETNPKFSQEEFEKKWVDAHDNERHYGAHGKESKLVDITKLDEYTYLSGIVGSWTRTLIYYYIDRYENTNQ